jgi:hypothetical protein
MLHQAVEFLIQMMLATASSAPFKNQLRATVTLPMTLPAGGQNAPYLTLLHPKLSFK